jgi:hypothetical protein
VHDGAVNVNGNDPRDFHFAGVNFFQHGYLLGYHNGGYTQQVDWFVDDIAFWVLTEEHPNP